MESLLLTYTCLLLSFCSHSQNLNWHYMFGQAGNVEGINRYTDVFFVNKHVGFAIGDDIIKTIDGGKTWLAKTNFGNATYHHLRSIEFLGDQTTGIAGTLSSRIYRTTDAGETWQDISLNVIDTIDTFGVRGICGLGHYGDIFYGVGVVWGHKARFYKSTDKGITWTVQGIDTSLATQLIDVVFLSEDTGFVSGAKASIPSQTEESVILKTVDGGATWTKVFSDKVISGRIWKLQSLNSRFIVGSIEPRFYPDTVAMVRTRDGGTSWEIIGAGSTRSLHGTQGIGFATEQKGWLGGWYPGMFETTDGGTTWQKLNFGSNLNRFFVLDSNDVVASGLGIYRYGDTSLLSSVGEDHDKPAKLVLSPIYPNPTNGAITIEFEIGFATNILLQIVSLDAKKVYTVFNRVHMPGKYKYDWDGSRLPAGQYLIWLDNNLAPITQKFTIIK